MTSFLRTTALLLALLFTGALVLPLHAQQPPSPTTAEDAPAPRLWNSLDQAQRDVLGPLEKKWDSMPSRKQAHMLKRAEHWVTLPPEKREAIRQHIAHWQTMTPQERQQTRANKRKFHQLSPAQRQQLHATYRRFQQLPADQRERLIRQWHALPPEQRLKRSEQPGHDIPPSSSIDQPVPHLPLSADSHPV